MARELVAIEENFSIALKPAPVDGAESPGGEPIEEAAIAANAGEVPTIVIKGSKSIRLRVGLINRAASNQSWEYCNTSEH
jgi:hypothetical protein